MITLPPEFVAKELLDETVDSVNVLAVKSGDTARLYSVRVFNQTEMSKELVDKMRKWNDEIKNYESKDGVNRFVPFEIRSDPATSTFYAIHPFFSRSLEFVCGFGVELFEDEKHAISFQLGDICRRLAPYHERLPIFPSRFVLHNDLHLQLTDLYPPNPIDEEAFEMGWFDQEKRNEDFFVRIMELLWGIDSESARARLFDYMNFTENAPDWGKTFIKKHRQTSKTDGLPPLIALDINRAKLTEFTPAWMCHALAEIVNIVPNLDEDAISKRVVPVIRSIIDADHDIVQCFILLLLVEVAKKVGLSGISNDDDHTQIDWFMFQNYIDDIFSSEKRVASRFVLCCILPDLLSCLSTEDGKNLIRALIVRHTDVEMAVFMSNFAETMVSLNKTAANLKPPTVKPFVCQLLNYIPLTDNLLGSLISMPPSLYVVDALLAKMAPQIKSQVEMRYLIAVAKFASPSMLFRFRFLDAATSNLTVSSLALVFLQRLKTLVHPVDYSLLIPGNVQADLVWLPETPEPVNDTVLETISSLIIRKPAKEPEDTIKTRPKDTQTTRITLELGSVNDFDFTSDGKYFFAVDESQMRVYHSATLVSSFSTTQHDAVIDFSVTVDRVAALGDGAIIAGHAGTSACFIETSIATASTSGEPTVVPGVGKVTVMEKSRTSDFLLIGTDSGHVLVKEERLPVRDLFTIPSTLGVPISIGLVPSSTYYVIGTTTGSTLLYDLRMQCPVRRMRPSNRPAIVAPCDSSSFWMTCGPFCGKFDVRMSTIQRTFSAPPAHVVSCCCIGEWLVTAHSDYSVYAYNQRASFVENMNNPEIAVHVNGGGCDVRARQSMVTPLHESQIRILRSSPLAVAPISCDANGVVVFWPTPVTK